MLAYHRAQREKLMGGAGMISLTDPEDLRAFLREWYLHSRFEGRDEPAWGRD